MRRQTFLPFHQPDLDGDELQAIGEVLDSGWLTTGKKTLEFEAAFADYVGASRAVAVNSCTAAMHLALEAVGIEAGDGVVTSPYTFAATAEVVRYFDAVPVFADVEAETLNLDPHKLAEMLEKKAGQGERVKAVIPVHIGGHPCDLDAIYALAEAYNLVVIEDAAHALPTRYKGWMIGGRRPKAKAAEGNQEAEQGAISAANTRSGRDGITCFSFYATKTLTTGEGGMITTEDEAWAERCRVMSNHGISKDAFKRYTAEGSWYYQVVAPGFKYNMPDLSAAMGLAQLRKVERMWGRRSEIAAQYSAGFGPYVELQPPGVQAGMEHAWHLYILRLNLARLGIDRRAFIEELRRRNIGASVHFIPLHLHPYYATTYGYQPQDFPTAYAEYQRAISLPIYSRMKDEDVRDVIEAVTAIVEENRTEKVCRVDVRENSQVKE